MEQVMMFCSDCKVEVKAVPKLYVYTCSVCSKTLGQRVKDMRIYIDGGLIGSCKKVILS